VTMPPSQLRVGSESGSTATRSHAMKTSCPPHMVAPAGELWHRRSARASCATRWVLDATLNVTRLTETLMRDAAGPVSGHRRQPTRERHHPPTEPVTGGPTRRSRRAGRRTGQPRACDAHMPTRRSRHPMTSDGGPGESRWPAGSMPVSGRAGTRSRGSRRGGTRRDRGRSARRTPGTGRRRRTCRRVLCGPRTGSRRTTS